MTRKQNLTEQRIYALWKARTDQLRTSIESEPFTREVWSMGLRLSRSEFIHYQRVMDVIRNQILE